MAVYRTSQPQMSAPLFLAACGLETTLIFHDHVQLPEFCSFDVLRHPHGESLLLNFYRQNAAVATESGLGMVIGTPTWRCNRAWAAKIGCPEEDLPGIISHGVRLLEQVRSENPSVAIVIAGRVGPLVDGYKVSDRMTPVQAEEYHRAQIESFANERVDIVSAVTFPYPEEVVGIVEACKKANIPVEVSFTTETDGKLPCGLTIDEAIGVVDAATGNYPLYYMVNCSHPSHFRDSLLSGGANISRVKGVLANASRKSHAELNDSPELDSGNPEELAREVGDLKERLPGLTIVGGCCGTDYSHVREMAKVCLAIDPKTGQE